jgi:hypothetical protein
MPTLIIHAIDCKVVSSGTDAGLVQAVIDAIKGVADVGVASAPFLGPKGEAIGKALEAGKGLLTKIPGLISAIDKVLNSPDQLYLNLSNDERQAKIWPSGNYQNINGGQIARPNLRVPFNDAIDVNFWEYDTGSDDDFLGRLTVDKSHAGGIRYQIVAMPSEGNIYVVVYSIEGVVSPSATNSQVLFYNSTGLSVANTFDQAGNTNFLQKYPFSGGWTHITLIAPGIVLFYNAITGAATVNTFDPAGNTNTLKTYPFASGWTHIVAISPGIVLFYNAETGAATSNTFDPAGNTNTLKTYPFASGWTQITVIEPGIVLFYSAATGAGTANTFDQAGNTNTLQTYPFSGGWTQITVIRPGIVLFYNAETGVGVANTFDSAGNTNFLQRYAFSGGWTRITAISPGIVLFYNAATGLGVANTFDSAGNTNFLQRYAFSGGWTQIKKLK